MWRFYEAIPHKARSGRREPATDEPRLPPAAPVAGDMGRGEAFLGKKGPRKTPLIPKKPPNGWAFWRLLRFRVVYGLPHFARPRK